MTLLVDNDSGVIKYAGTIFTLSNLFGYHLGVSSAEKFELT